jgi:hypothetical protein
MEKGKETSNKKESRERKWWWFSHSCPTITRRRRRHGPSPFFCAAAAISFPVDFSSSYFIIWNTHTHTQKKCRSFSSIVYYVPSVFHSWIQSFKIIEKKDPTVRLRKRHSLFFFFFFLLFSPCFYVSCDINSVLKWKNHRTRDAWVVFLFHISRPPISFSPWQKVAQLIGRGRIVKVNTGPVFN